MEALQVDVDRALCVILYLLDLLFSNEYCIESILREQAASCEFYEVSDKKTIHYL